MENKCPCCSGKPYEECCKPFHDGALPPTALALMRSRYSAYALKKARYIMETTHPQSPYFEKNRKNWETDILIFGTNYKFVKLEILDFSETQVHFAAHLEQNGIPSVLEEKSHFQKIEGKWLYLNGEILNYPKQSPPNATANAKKTGA
ncbi:MAG: YchJ family metal-binding protein [Chlamydiota bacterium]